MKKVECIILGAGGPGLACALTLKKGGFKPLLLEAKSQVGGRVATKTSPSGFRMDEGFQVILNSHPEFEKFVDLSKLNLKTFNSGALIYNVHSLDLNLKHVGR